MAEQARLRRVSIPGKFQEMVGAPVTIRFRAALSRKVFDRWIEALFGSGNAFGLWGHPLRLGPRKVQVFGVDRQLWQPFLLELTAQWCVLIVRNDMTGKVGRRLWGNIRRHLDPDAEAFLGDQVMQMEAEASSS